MLHVELPSFAITAHHDLLNDVDLFGLRFGDRTASRRTCRCLSPVPLFVSEGAQDVVARFFAEGFEAAAVTAFGIY